MEKAYLKTVDNKPVITDGCYVFVRVEEEDIAVPTEMINVTTSNICVGLPDGKEVQLMFESKPTSESSVMDELSETHDMFADAELEDVVEVEEEAHEGKWGDTETRTLISLYKKLSPHVGKTTKFKTKTKMWNFISLKLAEKNYAFTGTQVCNKWKTLERRYKDIITSKRTGRAMSCIPYEVELTEILGNDMKILPATLDGNTESQDETSGMDISDLNDDGNLAALNTECLPSSSSQEANNQPNASSTVKVRSKDGKTAHMLHSLQVQMQSTNELLQKLIDQRQTSNELKDEKNKLLREYINMKKQELEMRSSEN